MDSITGTIKQVQQNMKTFPNSSNDQTGKCKHGTECMIDEDGALCLWQCSKCCAEKEEKEREIKDAEEKRRRFGASMMRPYGHFTNIPRRFSGKTVTNYEAKNSNQILIKGICEKYIKNFNRVADNGISMIFCGKPGTGKTHLAYGIVNALQKQIITAVFTSAADMTSSVKSAIRESYVDGWGFEIKLNDKDVIKEYATFELLVVDEVGVQVDSDAERRIFFDIINKRYEEMMPTILLSNLTLDELTTFIGERVADRMRENGGTVFAFDWESYR